MKKTALLAAILAMTAMTLCSCGSEKDSSSKPAAETAAQTEAATEAVTEAQTQAVTEAQTEAADEAAETLDPSAEVIPGEDCSFATKDGAVSGSVKFTLDGGTIHAEVTIENHSSYGVSFIRPEHISYTHDGEMSNTPHTSTGTATLCSTPHDSTEVFTFDEPVTGSGWTTVTASLKLQLSISGEGLSKDYDSITISAELAKE
ncbi:MAG: hypothetical protein IJ737_06680 [Ruminococcus sp.]|nr:hypothetical protein [Ruminococcus sp.]